MVHTTQLENFEFKYQILNSNKLLWSLTHVINLVKWIRYMRCHSPPP
jgi:hypothetical protein